MVPKHDSESCYRALSEDSKGRIAQAVKAHGWQQIEDFLAYLDESMCHPDGKYWMVGPAGFEPATGRL